MIEKVVRLSIREPFFAFVSKNFRAIKAIEKDWRLHNFFIALKLNTRANPLVLFTARMKCNSMNESDMLMWEEVWRFDMHFTLHWLWFN